MAKYMIHVTHEPEQCVRTFDSYVQAGAHYLTHAEWGCAVGVHEGWTVVDADTYEDATLMVPPIIRGKAEVVRIARFTPEEMLSMHADEQPLTSRSLTAVS